MTDKELKAKLDGRIEGWYIFTGEEEYLKRYYLSLIKKAVITDDFTEPFNYVVLDGAEVDIGKLVDAVISPPMMSEYKLVVWKFADFEHMKDAAKKAFDALVEKKGEYSYTVLVLLPTAEGFDVGNLPKRPSKLYTKYSKDFHIVDFPPSTDAQLLGWLRRHFEAEGVKAAPDALSRLIFRAGHSMDTLAKETEKLSALAKARGLAALTVAEVDEAASSTPECDAFALSNAILSKDKTLALMALAEMKYRRVEPAIILGMLVKSYAELLSCASLLAEGMRNADIEKAMKLNPYKAKLLLAAARKRTVAELVAAMDRLSEVDLFMKSGTRAGYTAIEIFICSAL